jgi:hypothetical protein
LTGECPDLAIFPKTGMTKLLTLWDMHTAWIKAQQQRTIETMLKEGGGIWAGAFGPSAWPGRTEGSAKPDPGVLDWRVEGLRV